MLRLTATIPFDDRQCQKADLEDLRLPLIQAYLKEVGSELHIAASKMPLAELCRQMNIVDGADEHVKPRNVGVLFFNDEPSTFLPGCQIDVVIFPKGPGGGELVEKVFRAAPRTGTSAAVPTESCSEREGHQASESSGSNPHRQLSICRS
ncbi:MAG: hypothetical protein R3C11_24560 [Planctomycetaceae bacterium]